MDRICTFVEEMKGKVDELESQHGWKPAPKQKET
jgi:hypothetical protein